MSRQMVRVLVSLILALWGISILGFLLFAHSAQAHRGRLHQNRDITWPTEYFAPYVNDVANGLDLVALSQASGARFFTLAFIESSQSKDCRATWNTRQSLDPSLRVSIDALRASGGDVRIAFGGSANSELAATCHTVRALQAQYQAVLAAYHPSHLDFDVEGQTLHNTQATQRRNQVIAALQCQAARTGQQLIISYTLPVETTGLTASSLNLLRNAIQDGVHISAINIMTMDYYSQHAPGDQMGQNAIAAATSVVHQLQALYPARSAAQLWKMLGLTPMIGVNDNPSEVFNLQDAQTVVAFAEQQQLAMLAFWSLGRDRACAPDQNAPHGCSGVVQQPYDYAQAFAAFGT